MHFSKLLLALAPLIVVDAAPTPATPLITYKTWNVSPSGCWSDLVGNLRTLDTPMTSVNSSALTTEVCLDACADRGFFLGGVEYGRECFCGNTIVGSNAPIATSTCNFPCTGNPSQTCGGSQALNLYVRANFVAKKGPASPLASYKGYTTTGCWQDSAANRVLPGRVIPDIDRNTMTVEKCIDNCSAQNYTSAGVEFGGECYCGNVGYPLGALTPVSDCNMACLGDASEICGGRNRISTYQKLVPASIVTNRGIIGVTNGIGGPLMGYLANTANLNAIYRYVPTEADAMIVTFQAPQTATAVTQAAVTTLNSGSLFPALGLVQGRASPTTDLGLGSYNYAYVTGATPSVLGSVTQMAGNLFTAITGIPRAVQTNVWNVDLASGSVTPQWKNSDGSSPPMKIVSQDSALYVTSDKDTFTNQFKLFPTNDVGLRFLARPS